MYTPFLCFIFSDISRSMIDAAKTIMEGVRDKNGTDSVFYDKSGEVLKRADQKVIIMLCYTVLYYVIARYFVIYRLALYFVIYRLALYFIIYRLAQYFIILFHELRKWITYLPETFFQRIFNLLIAHIWPHVDCLPQQHLLDESL